MRFFWVCLIMFVFHSAQAKACVGNEAVGEPIAQLIQKALKKTFNQMTSPNSPPTQLDDYEVTQVCEILKQGLNTFESEVHVDVSYWEYDGRDSQQAFLEITSCQIYLKYDDVNQTWNTSEVVCDNDFGWFP